MKRSSDILQARQRFFALAGLSCVLLAAVLFPACTTTKNENLGAQDEAFVTASFDQEKDEVDVTVRNIEDTASETGVSHLLRKDFYLPAAALKSLTKRAEQAREKLNGQSPGDPASLRTLATEALVTGRPELVDGYLRLAKHPRQRKIQNPEELQLAGIAAFQLGDVMRARRLLSEAAQQPLTEASARANLGLIALKQGSLIEALELFKQAQQADPSNTRLGHLFAEAAYGCRKYSLALEAYKKIIARNEDDVLAQYNLGLVYLYGMRDFKLARKSFKSVMDHPKTPHELRSQADGAFASVQREEEGAYGLAVSQ
ncbi:MAG: hypothetical protein RIR26_1193 [Pseudomonadota bacterium]|jgi:tetratricopeptide (TPR) repeat protein